MAARPSAFDNSPSSPFVGDENWTDNSPSRPLSGPGSSRQTRRLQLRNAGFRGGALPTRKVTPKSSSTSTSAPGVSDAENVSPSGARSGSLGVGKRQSSGVLQEIGNSTLTRPKKTRPRIPSAKLFAMNTAGTSALGDEDPLSPPPPKTSIRAKGTKTRAKMNNKRRSVSAEMGKYIDHLEMELAAAQSQLSAITSPTVTREQSSKVRNLNAETKQLQQELEEWENKYEQRVQDALDEHVITENGLRNRIRNLEEEAEEARYRAQELEARLQEATEQMNSTESANVNLEKRLEIMSELLATSPTKIDLHAETPGRRRRQQRPQSMLPRFPTASSLNCSPERQPVTQPASPLLSFAAHSPTISFSPVAHEPLRLDQSPQPSDIEQTDAESVFSDVLGATDSITSAETTEAVAAFNPWSLPPVREGKTKPARRMRRFGAGSMGPKPLILPSTSACEQYPPSSAPPLERRETTPVFFPEPAEDNDEDDLDLANLNRRRASTMAGEIRVSSLGSPAAFLNAPKTDEGEESMLSVLTPPADHFQDTSRDFSSIGSNVGRNLMEELSQISTNDSHESYGDHADEVDAQLDGEPSGLERGPDEVEQASLSSGPASEERPTIPSRPTSTKRPSHHRRRSSALQPTTNTNTPSIFTRLRLLFRDLWHAPVALARHLVQTAQTRMRLPSPLLNAQWWLVGILLGPMAKRRLLAQRGKCRADDEPLMLAEDDHEARESSRGGEGAGDLAYGTFNPSPTPSTSSSLRHRRSPSLRKTLAPVAGKTRCTHLHHRRKHSPLLWLKFSLTLAFAVGAAFAEGPGALLRGGGCGCWMSPMAEQRNRATSS